MKLLPSVAVAALSLTTAVAAVGWSFEDATLTVQAKSSGVGGAVKEKLSPESPLSDPVTLSASDSLKIVLTATEGTTGRRPHQAFLTLHEPTTGLVESFPFSLKDNGKGKVEFTPKDLPYQLASPPSGVALQASILIASFGTSAPYNHATFTLTLPPSPNEPLTAPETPERYAAKPEIHHQFRAGPAQPPRLLSTLFTFAILATLPVLLIVTTALGGNLGHVSAAFGAAPVAHGVFVGSLLAMEGVFFAYYIGWNLFQTLPVAGVVGIVAFVSGGRALTEVQERRVKGER
ncbi:hypothetical protein B0A50_07291 [Salinomyces thailandicus]|uniref:Ribophorin II C-terminal domain-containing protein n=1 Tax=Salinomyces thailandicus TaxID=706561 RepID=A0A4U0TNT9_9PEZI|nr:hypothetical protein B0A50_07291 [Salinomyces thailandica]